MVIIEYGIRLIKNFFKGVKIFVKKVQLKNKLIVNKFI